jgi:signal transduction histidine kinase
VALIISAGVLAISLFTELEATAQTAEPEPLVVPFTSIPPFMQIDADGERSGFIVDLSELIGSEIGVPVEYLEVANSREFVAAQVSGNAQLIAGILKLPPLAQSNVFSQTVASDALRPAVLERNRELFQTGEIAGRRIAVVPPALGSEEPILEKNTPVEFESPFGAVMALLAGDVDAVLLPNPIVYGLARQAGVDGRIAFVGKPLREATRHVALHESRADLLEPINEAITRLEGDGRLDALRLRYNISVPAPPPETLTVGINHAPPYGLIDGDGSISGFTAEMWTELASRANLAIQFQAVSGEVYSAGPTAASGLDAAGLLFISEQRAARMDFALPVQRIDYRLFYRKDNPPSDLANPLRGHRVGVLPQSLSDESRRSLADVDIVHAPSIDALVDGLLDGTYDEILTLPLAAEKLFAERGASDKVEIYKGALFSSELAPALRPGLGAVRERLNAVIPGYLLSDVHAALQEKYFGTPVFWTKTRVYGAIGAVAAAFLSLLGFLWWQGNRQQLRELELERVHSSELTGVVSRLEQSNREQAEFTYAVSHDLKSPSNTIAMLINEMSETGDLGPDAQDLLTDMDSTNKRMRQLVDDVLVYSRIVDGGVGTELVDLNLLIDEIWEDLKSARTEADAALLVSELPHILGSRVQLRMLFQNLLVNAIKFRRPGRTPEIEVSGRQLPNGVEITVTDNGIGIPQEHRDRVFGLFQRLNPHTAYEGSGLGLTICKRVMSNHKGQIRLGDGNGGGAAFTLNFPAVLAR